MKNSLIFKQKKVFQDQKKNIHEYLQGEQKFRKEFLLNTFFQIEAEERNKKKRLAKKKVKPVSTPIPTENDLLRNIKKSRLEEDLKAYNSISHTGFYKFSEKLSLYNDYSTAFIVEPEPQELVKQYMGLKSFKLISWKKSRNVPMSAYIRKVKTLYSKEQFNSPQLVENTGEEREERIKTKVINAFKLKKNPADKGIFCYSILLIQKNIR